MFIAGAVIVSLASGQIIATYDHLRDYQTLFACKKDERRHMPAAVRLAHQYYGPGVKVVASCTKS